MKTIQIFILIAMVLLHQSCAKDHGTDDCVEPGVYYRPLEASALAQTPYFTNPAFDTISFASDKGDTVIFIKTRTDTSWNMEEGQGSPDCGYDKIYFQALHNSYTTIKGNGSFDIKHSLKDQNQTQNIIQISFNNYKFYVSDYAINDSSHPRYLGSVIKNNKTFINTIYSNNNFTDSASAICYINKDYGMFYIEDKINGLKYTIIN